MLRPEGLSDVGTATKVFPSPRFYRERTCTDMRRNQFFVVLHSGQHHGSGDLECPAPQLRALRTSCLDAHRCGDVVSRRISVRAHDFYAELIEKALCIVSRLESIGRHSFEYALRARSPCFLCAMNLRNSGPAGASPRSRLDRGRDNSTLRAFAGRLAPAWRSWLCPECAGRERAGAAPTLCRQHLIAAIRAHGPVDISTQRNLLQDLYDHVARYQDLFFVGGPEASDQDRAALIAAIGWCSGWRLLLSQLPLVVTENT